MVECNVHCLFVSITHGTKRDDDDDDVDDDDVSCENTSAPMLLVCAYWIKLLRIAAWVV